MNKFISKLLFKIPFIRYAIAYKTNAKMLPGHFYSPVLNLEELKERGNMIWNSKKRLIGIELNELVQKNHLDMILLGSTSFLPNLEKKENLRYFIKNDNFPYPDALVLSSMLKHYKPNRIIEIGCGYSSALMLDFASDFLNHTKFHFIEPNPEMAFNKILKKTDLDNTNITISKDIVQNIKTEVFTTLQSGDFLFVDNSHVCKTGSDVNFIFTEILPILNKGVLIHIHDIFYPFEYPKNWALTHKLNWNEIFIMHSFLLFNHEFQILFFADYMQQQFETLINNTSPNFLSSRAGSIWIQKVG
jgi:predicted O-methyltransferase YrrM